MKYLIVVVFFLATDILLSVESRGRIFNGDDADYSKFKYQVKIIVPVTKDSKIVSKCGGSLISNKWVLTAAHCLTNGYINSTKVKLGFDAKNKPKIVLDPLNIIIHKGYNPKKKHINDIALIQIPDVPYDDSIQNVTLSRKTTLDVYNVTVAGWGITDTGAISEALQYTTLRVMNITFCKSKYKSNQALQFCTFGENTKTCVGDSGGAAVIEGTLEQVGIVSYGITKHCIGGFPTYFTRVSAYLPWIAKKTGLSF